MSRPKEKSLVDVTFVDGEVKTYMITAGITISQYLAKEAADTGILTLFNDEVSHGIPVAQIREYVIRRMPDSETEDQAQ